MIDEDRVRGALYGQAIGDALGLPGEFKSRTLLRMQYGDEGPTDYEAVNRTGLGGAWQSGEWSDDTEQALAILDAYLEDGDLNPQTVASNFHKWATTNGRGMGNHTWNVLSNGLFGLDPIAASEEVWERSGQRSAPNGGVMRTSVVGILRPEDLIWTEKAAAMACRVTHYDPRCVASSVALSVAIAVLVTGGDVEAALDNATARSVDYDDEINDWCLNKSLDDLALDEGMEDPKVRRPPIGYTYKCVGAAFWALREFQRQDDAQYDDFWGDRFLRVLQQVIMAGGDTDTNGAVAGAILGARVGLEEITANHPRLVKGLFARSELDKRAVLLAALR